MSKFEKGFDPRRNTKGRPKKQNSLAEALRKRMDLDAIAEKVVGMAMDGDLPAIKILFEYSYGKPDPEFERRIDEIQQKLDAAIAESRGNHAA